METLGVTTADTGSTVGNIFQGLADASSWLYQVVTVAFVGLAYVIGNWRDVVGLALSGVMLGVVQAGAQIAYQFGTVVPGIVSWMAQNWREILTDVVNFTSTVLGNVASNLTSFMGAVASLLTGGGFDYEWTGLTEGFESSLKQMPEIAAREIGPIEQGLQDQFDAMQQTVGTGLDAALTGNKSTTKNITDGLTGAVKTGLDNLPKVAIDAPTIATPAPIAPPKVGLDTKPAEAALDGMNDKVKETAASWKALTAGSAASMQVRAQSDFAAQIVRPDSPAASVASPVASRAREAMQSGTRRPDQQQSELLTVIRQLAANVQTIAREGGVTLAEAV